ncbi:RNA-binding motif, single-stranded-interacting protein 2-like isoform X3 [Oppia nitens]|uniref:RNA-binding motif, single-stranded-interacting protein 2-like isoform X3 n=1 Tax=Oppia nitens TaxID=1686743 RepID=UPI0023D9DE8F|nr:RNA-binding motif, single-stranded-interacting protein 2-like isoform X3 [Oppia nitens]
MKSNDKLLFNNSINNINNNSTVHKTTSAATAAMDYHTNHHNHHNHHSHNHHNHVTGGGGGGRQTKRQTSSDGHTNQGRSRSQQHNNQTTISAFNNNNNINSNAANNNTNNNNNRQNKGHQGSRMPASSPPVSTASTGGSSQTASNGSASASSSASANSGVGVTGNGNMANTGLGGGGGGGQQNGNSSLAEQLSKTNLYIRGLTPTTTDKDLYALCSPYGTIISTKAILDKNTNKCKGYGFVDFESPIAAENAVKNLQTQGVQAQMAKCTDTNRNKLSSSSTSPQTNKLQQQEQDPTNLYIANLPPYMTETELESMLAPYGTVISTRILRDANMQPRGVGFARMESKEKCESIITIFNGKLLPTCKEALLVKFADGGTKKKSQFKTSDGRWRDGEPIPISYDGSGLTQNGVATPLMQSAMSQYQRQYSTPVSAAYPTALQTTPWLHPQAPTQYIVQPHHMAQVIPGVDPNTLHFSTLMPQLTAQMSQIQLSGVSGASYVTGNPHAAYGNAMYPTQLIQTMGPMGGDDPSNPNHSVSSGSASGEDQHSYQMYNQSK